MPSDKPREHYFCEHCNRVLWVDDDCDCEASQKPKPKPPAGEDARTR